MNESEMLGGDDEPIPRQGRYIYRRRKRINTESSDEVIAIKTEDEKDGDEEDAWKQQPMKKRSFDTIKKLKINKIFLMGRRVTRSNPKNTRWYRGGERERERCERCTRRQDEEDAKMKQQRQSISDDDDDYYNNNENLLLR
ncbi:hypothetical protein RUM44_001133 [Polyplax serrata]|uniref:Uncharacterized protein n=1 Tax=Polyplax serrata TaxID=468196 RepID=A0ABR1B6U2_POLSC